MRARFTDSIASADFSYSAGQHVSVEGERYGFDTVPEKIGRQWLASGLLEPVGVESASLRSPETAALAAASPRPARAARS